MPLRWEGAEPDAGRDRPAGVVRLRLWPHRSLPRTGFAAAIGLAAAAFALPLLGTLGTPVLWGFLPFFGAALALLWWALARSYRDGALTEDLALAPDRIRLVRSEPGGRRREWEADPHWVRVELHPDGGPVTNYLTLRGGGRTVELGAFLTPEEREELYRELVRRLRAIRGG